MVDSNSPDPVSPNLLLDSDVLINWLALEEDIVTAQKLWEAPHEIMKMIADNSTDGFSTLINIMEIRSVLRRKKEFDDAKIKTAIEKLTDVIRVTVPDEINLLKAGDLQIHHPLSVMDAVILSVAVATPNVALISRDKELIKIAARFLPASTPEELLLKLKVR